MSEQLLESAAELLEKAAALWRRAELTRRDGALEVGRVLHDFVVAYLREADGLTEYERLKQGRTRHKAACKAAERLRMKVQRVNWLIATAKAADLLSGGNLGNLAWGSIVRFVRFIKRKGGRGRKYRKQAVRPHVRLKSYSISASQEWVVRPEFEGKAQALFRKAVEENWSQLEARTLVFQLGGKKEWAVRPPKEKAETAPPVPAERERQAQPSPMPSAGYASRRRKAEPTTSDLDALRQQVANGSPRDVAEFLWDFIKEADNPAAVVAHLARMAGEKKHSKLFQTASR